ncbi:MAG: LPS assembly lipoprotein LptE [Succinivibrionaceae bacterium]
MIIKKILLIISCGLLSGCGFHLMNSTPVKDSYPQLVFNGDYHNAFYKELFKKLKLKGIEVIEYDATIHNNTDLPILNCGNMSGGSSTLSVGSNSQNLEYTYKNSISCYLKVPNKKNYTMSSTVNRNYLSHAGSTLASDQEEETMAYEAARILSEEIIFRLRHSYLGAENITPTKQIKEEKPIKIVFDVTSEEPTTVYENLDKTEEIKEQEIKEQEIKEQEINESK